MQDNIKKLISVRLISVYKKGGYLGYVTTTREYSDESIKIEKRYYATN